MRILSILQALCLATLVAVPASAKKPIFEEVTSPVADKAGYAADTELDFKRLSAEAAAEGVTLTIETWAAWAGIPGPEDSQISILCLQENGKGLLPNAFRLRMKDGALVLSEGPAEGDAEDGAGSGDWMPAAGTWQASIDGKAITVTIPWEQFPVASPRIQVWSAHALENTDPETGEVTVTYTHGKSAGVPTDDVPNKGKVLAIER